jgi:MFS family permease
VKRKNSDDDFLNDLCHESIIILQFDWVCDDAWKGPFSQTLFMLGSAVGCLSFGVASDRFGRLPIFVVSNLILLIGGVTLPYCTNFYSFLAVRFLMGLTFNTFYLSIYLLGNYKHLTYHDKYNILFLALQSWNMYPLVKGALLEM